MPWSLHTNRVLALKVTILQEVWEEKPYLSLDFPGEGG
jgi:hypothetical protein